MYTLSKAVRVEIEMEKDGKRRIYRASGEEAEKWHKMVDGFCTIASVHGFKGTDINWEIIEVEDEKDM
jgi:hypothetical protein